MENTPRRHHSAPPNVPTPLKPYLVHVTWNATAETAIKYIPRRRMVIISPMANSSPYAVNFVPIDSKGSQLKQSLFEPIVSVMPKDTVYFGSWKTDGRDSPAGILINNGVIDQSKKEKYWQKFAKLNDVDIPDDEVAKQQVTYAALVAKLLEKMYSLLQGGTLRVIFHGLHAAPCYLMLNKKRFFSNMETVYLMDQPVLGEYVPHKRDSIVPHAISIGRKYWYDIEKLTLTTIDHFITIFDPEPMYWLVKRMYGRVPSLSFNSKGKNKAVGIQLDLEELKRMEEEIAEENKEAYEKRRY